MGHSFQMTGTFLPTFLVFYSRIQRRNRLHLRHTVYTEDIYIYTHFVSVELKMTG